MKTNVRRSIFTLAKANLQLAMTYRTNFILGLGSIFVLIFVHFNLWKIIFEVNNVSEINGFSFSAMVSYVIISRVFYVFVNSMNFEEKVAKEIKDGSISTYLVKPFNYFLYNFSIKMGDALLQFLVSVCAFLIILSFIPGVVALNIQTGAFVLITLLFGLFLNTLIGYIFALSAFWIEQADILFVFKKNIINFISGVWIPISFFPKQIRNVLHFLPFNYLQYFSVEIMLGKLSSGQIYERLVIQMVWLIVLYIISVVMWKKGVKKYTSFGG